MDEYAWLQQSEEILRDIKEWRRAHPKATFVEIADEVPKRMMQLEAQILQDADAEKVAVESGEERRVRDTHDAPPVQCPYKHEGNTSAPCKAMEGKASPCTERMELAPPVGRVFFPLDEA